MNVVLCIQACEEEDGCVQLMLEGMEDLRYHLNAQQARDIAAHLIQHAHRSDVKASLQRNAMSGKIKHDTALHLVPSQNLAAS